MPNRNEKNLYKRIENWLDTKENCRYKKLKGGMLMRNEPDYIIIILNRAMFIEVKQPGERVLADDAQAKRMRYWGKACRVAWCDSLEGFQSVVNDEERIAKRHRALEENMSE